MTKSITAASKHYKMGSLCTIRYKCNGKGYVSLEIEVNLTASVA